MNPSTLNWTPLFSIVARYSSLSGKFKLGEHLFVGLLETSPGWHRVHVRNAEGKTVNRILRGPWRKQTAAKHARQNFSHCSTA